MAVNTFKAKYNALPGDMPPAQAAQLGFFTFTGTFAGRDCLPSTAAYGNNDSAINGFNETLPFWSHLGDSGLIAGRYSGVAGNLLNTTASSCPNSAGYPISACALGVCQPQSKLSKNTQITAYANVLAAPNKTWVTFSRTQKNNMFTFSSKVYQAYGMDVKIDDGMPATGDVRDSNATDYFTGAIVGYGPCTTLGATAAIRFDLSPATVDSGNCAPAFLF